MSPADESCSPAAKHLRQQASHVDERSSSTGPTEPGSPGSCNSPAAEAQQQQEAAAAVEALLTVGNEGNVRAILPTAVQRCTLADAADEVKHWQCSNGQANCQSSQQQQQQQQQQQALPVSSHPAAISAVEAPAALSLSQQAEVAGNSNQQERVAVAAAEVTAEAWRHHGKLHSAGEQAEHSILRDGLWDEDVAVRNPEVSTESLTDWQLCGQMVTTGSAASRGQSCRGCTSLLWSYAGYKHGGGRSEEGH